MIKHLRWYDNSNLKEVFAYIKNLDEEHQEWIAHNILQIIVNECNMDLDSEINKIYTNIDYDYKRWYDDKVELFNSFEIIKNLSKDKRKTVEDKIIRSILFSHLEQVEHA